MKLTRKQIYAAKTLAELETLAKRNGYSKFWALKVHQARVTKKRLAALLILCSLTACNDAAMAKCEAAGYSKETCFKQLNN